MYVQEDKRCSAPSVGYQAYNDGDAIVIEMKVPGYTKEDIEIKATKDAVQVFGKEVKDDRWRHGFYNRYDIKDSKTLDVTSTETKVSLTTGILRISLPIMEEFQSVKLEIK